MQTKLKNVPQTKKAKQCYSHPIIDLLLSDTPKTKEELAEALHVTTDRSVRDTIAVCSMHYPVIATSDKAGYRRAKDIDRLIEDGPEALEAEIDEVEHQLNELKSRVTCLKKRMKPLVAWLSVAKKKRDGNNE